MAQGTVKWYRYVDNVYTFMLRDVVLSGGAFTGELLSRTATGMLEMPLSRLKLIAVDSKNVADCRAADGLLAGSPMYAGVSGGDGSGSGGSGGGDGHGDSEDAKSSSSLRTAALLTTTELPGASFARSSNGVTHTAGQASGQRVRFGPSDMLPSLLPPGLLHPVPSTSHLPPPSAPPSPPPPSLSPEENSGDEGESGGSDADEFDEEDLVQAELSHVAGAPGSSSEDDGDFDDGDDGLRDDAFDEEDADVRDGAATAEDGNMGAFDEEELNSDDDEDELDDEEGDGGANGGGTNGVGATHGENRIIAQFDRVKRARNQWKITLRAGDGQIIGRSYLFSRCDAELTY